jgi:endonuclease G
MNSKVLLLCVLLCVLVEVENLSFVNHGEHKNLLERKFSEFTTWISCEERLPILFNYMLNSTNGNMNRSSSFRFDPQVNRSCQQISTAGYGFTYERGHMVPANHMDHSLTAIKESNYMTNIAPQTLILNRQAWYFTEELTQCWKKYEDLDIIGGLIMGNNKDDDFYIKTHGVRTPDYFWKIIHKLKSNEIIVWMMPNTIEAVKANVDKFLVSISEIEKRTGFVFNKFTEAQKQLKLEKSWPIPAKCIRA